MRTLEDYTIRLLDLKEGSHRFFIPLRDEFFAAYDNQIYQRGHIDCILDVQRSPAMYILEFHMQGTVQVRCDKCYAPIHLPVEERFRLMVKYSDHIALSSTQTTPNSDEVVVLPTDHVVFDLAPYLREFSILIMPPRNVYECRKNPPYPCDEVVLNLLNNQYDNNRKIDSYPKNNVFAQLLKKQSLHNKH